MARRGAPAAAERSAVAAGAGRDRRHGPWKTLRCPICSEGAAMSDESPTVPATRLQPSASYSFTMRLHVPQQGGAFARVAQAIAEAEAMLGAIDLVRVEAHDVVRDVTVACADSAHAEAVVRAVRA